MTSTRSRDLQMLEASRGSYTLAQMINMQSRAMSLEERYQCNGTSLLKSSLDLQESLIMLGKLQATNNVSQAATRNLMEEIEIEIIRSELGQASKRYALAVDRCNSRRSEEGPCSGSRRLKDGNGELKKVIIDSLCAQSTLSNLSDDDKASSRRSHVSFASSRFNASYDVESDRDTSSTLSQQSVRMTTPNLIARLMGLDVIPSEGTQPLEENCRPQGLILDTRIPTKPMRNPITVDQNLKPKRETLFDIIERERLERRRRSQRANESGVLLGPSDTSAPQLQEKQSYQWTARIKAAPCIDRGKFHEYYPSSYNLQQKLDQSAKQATEEYELEGDNFRSPSKSMPESASRMDEAAQSIMKLITVSSERFQEHQTPVSKKEFELVPKQIIPDGAHELSKGRNKNTIRKLEKPKVESAQNTKKLATNHIQNTKEAVKSSKQIHKSRKPNRGEMSPEKPKDSRVKRFQLSDSKTARLLATVVPDKRSSTFTKASAPVDSCGPTQTKPTFRNSSTLPRRKKNEKQPAQKSNTTKLVKKKDVATISPSCKTAELTRSTSCIDQHPQAKEHYLQSSITDKLRKDQKVICEVMPRASKVPCKVETTAAPGGTDITAKISKVEDFKRLLLKNRSFLMLAYECCTHARQPVFDENTNLNKEGKDEKLYLACANEFMARQIYTVELSKHPMSTIGLRLSTCASLDQLVEVICRGMRTLSDYSKGTEDDISNDDLYVRLRKDIECKKMMLNSVWDLGWWNGISMNVADQVVGQVEESILWSLVEETVTELLH